MLEISKEDACEKNKEEKMRKNTVTTWLAQHKTAKMFVVTYRDAQKLSIWV